MKSLHDIRTEYSAKPLLPEEMAFDPLVQFNSWFEEIETYNIPDSNAATLATYDSRTNRVRSRIILIKEITKQGIIFFSNYESDKGQEISSHPQVSLTIFWSQLFRQVRCEGLVSKIAEIKSDEYFLSRPKMSQVSAIISGQSKIINSRLELEKKYNDLFEKNIKLSRPTYWGGYEIKSDYWEFWQGQKHRLHDRICYKKNLKSHEWTKNILEP